MKVTRHEPVVCPFCGYPNLDAALHTDEVGGHPSPGDVTLCIECGGVCVLNADMTLRKVQHDDLIGIPHEQKLMILMAKFKILELKERRERNASNASSDVRKH
jgi:hypothetical protein